KGAQKTPGIQSLYALLDSIKSTLGTTCFSEPMQEVGTVINDLKVICPNFCVTLFTDGCPVVPWGADEEIDRTMKAVNLWKDDALALHTVGYGYYYDQDFLRNLANQTAFGQFIHSSQIQEYFDIFSKNYEITSELVLEKVEVSSSADCILYLTRKSVVSSDGVFTTRALDKSKNQFIFLGKDEQDFNFFYDGVQYSTADLPNIPTQSIKPITYAIAYVQYYNGNRKQAISILANQLKDKFLVDQAQNAFTYDEVGAYTKLLRTAVFSTKGRMVDGECPEGYIPSDHAPCIMDILKILTNSNNAKYRYASDYNRIGVKVQDNFDLFQRDKDADILTPISELVLNKSRLNVSIRSSIPGTVKLNPRRAKQVGLPDVIPSKIYRTQTLIKDGIPNMSEASFQVDDRTLTDIRILLGDTFDRDVTVQQVSEDCYDIKIDFSSLPVINHSYVGDCTDCSILLKEVYRQQYNQAAQKVLNMMLDEVYAYRKRNGIFDTTKQMAMYTPQQIEVLQEHGLNDRAEYVGVANAKDPSGDSYIARELEFQLKGYSTLPTIEKFKQKINDGSKLNGPEQMMKDAMDSANAILHSLKYGSNQYLENLKLTLATVKANLANSRVAICSQKIALVLTGEWFGNLEVDKKGNYLYSEGGHTLVIKANRTSIPL
ncbi:MAG: hypothetical protein NC548_40625, partial [Lachnospiraceae bacterium]|nr:hypothetical protein [Lachnospiraceae bacterium]